MPHQSLATSYRLPREFRLVSTLWTLIALSLPIPVRADNLGAIGKGFGILLVGAMIVLAVMVVFIILAVVLGRRAKSGNRRGANGLYIATWVLALTWYAVTVAPLVYNLVAFAGHDLGWMALFTIVGGLPAHIASIVALFRAAQLKNSAQSSDAP